MKRTPLRRTTTASTSVEPAACQVCARPFFKFNSLQKVCAKLRCLAQVGKLKRKTERESDKARAEKLLSVGDWIQKAEKVLRRFRRLEELAKGRGCMSCGRTQQEVQGTDGWKPGGAWDGGHFMSKGARPELRLEPKNIWLQCKSCNGGSAHYARKGYTVGLAFEENLRAQEGDELVDWLKGPHGPSKPAVDDLKALIALYRAKGKGAATRQPPAEGGLVPKTEAMTDPQAIEGAQP